YSARAQPYPDEVGEVDKGRKAIPLEDRAWPLYREALVTLQGITDTHQDELRMALLEGPRNKNWNQVLERLPQLREPIDLAFRGSAEPIVRPFRGSERRGFGFVYRAPANDPWLAGSRRGTVEATWPAGSPGEVILPQIQELRWIEALLSAACHLAVKEEDGKG